MSSYDISSFSDTNSDYQDVGHTSLPLSPNVHATQSDVHIQSSQVQLQHVSTHETGTQYVMTRSVSCDTYDISTPTQPSMGVGYDMQSSQSRPVSPQVDHGYFRSTPYPNERTQNAWFEMSRASGT